MRTINKSLFIFLSWLLFSINVIGQDWGDWELLYKDNDIIVDIRFKEVNGCNDSKRNLVEYRVKGTLNSMSDYINWQTDYTDCKSELFFRQNSLDISIANEHSNNSQKAYGDIWPCTECEFLSEKIVRKHYDAKRSSYRLNNSGPQRPQNSSPAIAIGGPTKAYYNEEIVLRVDGGELGTGANWIWYKNACGGEKVGEGISIGVSLMETTTFYVRAEGIDKTKCVQKTVYVISKEPDYVSGGGVIKLEESAFLKVEGGALAPSSNWIWYENQCGSKKIGEGNSITVSPQNSTTYYVRAEGNSSTECKKVEVTILPKDPKSISATNTSWSFTSKENIEIGKSTTLSVVGGYLTKGEQWVWYENVCGGKRISTGSELIITPIESVSYYVRAEGNNTPSNCAQLAITPQIPNGVENRKANPYIDQFNFRLVNGKVRIFYKIKNVKSSDRFSLSIKGYRNRGELTLNSLGGSFDKSNDNLMKGRGKKKIIWDAQKDGYYLNEKIVFQLSADVHEHISLTPRLAKSLIFPGWGDVHLRNKNSRLKLGVAAYSFVAASVFFNALSNQNYNSYKNTANTESYDKAVKGNEISLACAGVAGALWTIDLVGILSRRHKVKKDVSLSDYYYNRSRVHINQLSEVKTINMAIEK